MNYTKEDLINQLDVIIENLTKQSVVYKKMYTTHIIEIFEKVKEKAQKL